MKVYCTLCYKKWDASKHIDKKNYICPHCDWKIKRNIPVRLGKRWKRNKKKKVDKGRDAISA